MPTPAPDRFISRCLNFPDRGVTPGSATRQPRWRTPERPASPSGPAATPGPESPVTPFPASETAVPQADGAA